MGKKAQNKMGTKLVLGILIKLVGHVRSSHIYSLKSPQSSQLCYYGLMNTLRSIIASLTRRWSSKTGMVCCIPKSSQVNMEKGRHYLFRTLRLAAVHTWGYFNDS